MPARGGRNMHKGHPLVKAKMGTWLQSPAIFWTRAHTQTHANTHTSTPPSPSPFSDCIDLFWQRPFGPMAVQLISSPVPFRYGAFKNQQHPGGRGPFSLQREPWLSGALITVFTHSRPLNTNVQRHGWEAKWCDPPTMLCICSKTSVQRIRRGGR